MKIAHISDLHIDKNYKKQNLKRSRQLIEYIAENNFDHVIISGDITENAEDSAFEIARGLFKRYGLLNSDKMTLTIGNHDIYGGVHLAEDVINFPSKCKATGFDKKVNDFVSYFRETFNNTIQPLKDSYFPFIKVFDEFVLISLNTNAKYSVIKNPFASNGEIPPSHLEAIEKALDKEEFKNKHKIVISHHHFYKNVVEDTSSQSTLWQAIERQTLKLRNKKSIIKKFNKLDVKMVLHGHLHETIEYSRKGIKFLNAGASVLGTKSETLNINVIEINGSNITSQIVNLNPAEKRSAMVKDFSIAKSLIQSSRLPKEICLN